MSGNVIVFGGSGFIGTHCVRRLHAAGAKIISVDLRPQRETLPGVTYLIGDVRKLDRSAYPTDIQTIYNFAAVHTTPGHPDNEYYDTNIEGALEITRLAEERGVAEIVFTSSISVYGPAEETKVETTPLAPTSSYGRSKRLAEAIHRRWLEADAARRLTIARPAVVFGPGEGGNFTRMAKMLRRGLFVFPGRRDTIKACIYVDDLLDCIEYARSKGQREVLFNGCYPNRYTLEQIVTTFRSMYFPKVRLIDLPLGAVVAAAKVLGALDVLHVGIHPDRVMKLVRSTDVYPDWLVNEGRVFPDALELALKRWAEATGGRFD